RLVPAVEGLEIADARGGEIARDTAHAGAVAPIGRQPDLDDRIVEAEDAGEGRTERRVGGQLDDALMLLGETQLAFRDEHAVALDAADGGLAQFDAGSGDDRAR